MCCRQCFMKFLQFLFTQQLIKLSNFWTESGDFYLCTREMFLYWLLFAVFVEFDFFPLLIYWKWWNLLKIWKKELKNLFPCSPNQLQMCSGWSDLKRVLNASWGCSHLHLELSTRDRFTQDGCWQQVWTAAETLETELHYSTTQWIVNVVGK